MVKLIGVLIILIGFTVMVKLIGVLIILIGFTLKLDTIAVVIVAGIATGLVSGILSGVGIGAALLKVLSVLGDAFVNTRYMTLLLLTVIVAGIATGLVSGILSGVGIGAALLKVLSVLGDAFVNTRYMTLLLLTLAVVGVLERNGLRERAAICISKLKGATCGKVLSVYDVIRTIAAIFSLRVVVGVLERNGLRERAAICISKLKGATCGKVLSVYDVIRTIAAIFSLRVGGHVQFIRPLIYPMAKGAAEKEGKVTEKIDEEIKGFANSVENYGNFFGQNGFVASAGVLLIVGTMKELGVENVEPYAVSKASLIMAVLSIVISIIRNYLFDMRIRRSRGGK